MELVTVGITLVGIALALLFITYVIIQATELTARTNDKKRTTPIPEDPDTKNINEWLVKAQKRMQSLGSKSKWNY
jgi:hypothetical protein